MQWQPTSHWISEREHLCTSAAASAKPPHQMQLKIAHWVLSRTAHFKSILGEEPGEI